MNIDKKTIFFMNKLILAFCYTELMSRKSLIYLCVAVLSTIGGLIPNLWGANFLSFSSVLLTAAGGFAGIWLGLKLSN